ncbi:MAG: tetratricopeptide repeat protein [SAR324 cluster bacterium]|nr:tetratricopeptide repeat protein [SAR324 cluster bacterium]
MKHWVFFSGIIAGIMLISGCGTSTTGGGPPVSGMKRESSAVETIPPEKPVPSSPSSRIEPAPTTQPAEKTTPAPRQSASGVAMAVTQLLERARAQLAQGELDPASATVERAVRLDPHHAEGWALLAVIRARQEKYEEALAFAQKSNIFAGDNESLRKQNAELMEHIRSEKANAFH